MRLHVRLALLCCLLPSFPGCALSIHTVGARSPLHPEPLDPAGGVCVVKSPDAQDEEWDRELTRKIEALLERDGYALSDSSTAEYYLFFDYRIRALLGRVRLDFISGSQTGIETVRREGPYVHTLALRVVDAEAYRNLEREEIIWQGGAVMSEVPTVGQRFREMVLVAAFDQFDKQSPETTTVKLRRNDARVRRLSR